jgi:hypothetical protein
MWLSAGGRAATVEDLLRMVANAAREGLIDELLEEAGEGEKPSSVPADELVGRRQLLLLDDLEAIVSLIRSLGCYKAASIIEEEYVQLRRRYEEELKSQSCTSVESWEQFKRVEFGTRVARTMLEDVSVSKMEAEKGRNDELADDGKDALNEKEGDS